MGTCGYDWDEKRACCILDYSHDERKNAVPKCQLRSSLPSTDSLLALACWSKRETRSGWRISGAKRFSYFMKLFVVLRSNLFESFRRRLMFSKSPRLLVLQKILRCMTWTKWKQTQWHTIILVWYLFNLAIPNNRNMWTKLQLCHVEMSTQTDHENIDTNLG